MREKIEQLVNELGISEIEKALEELKRDKCSCDNKPAARYWFHNYLMGVSMYKKENYPESLFFKNNDGRVIMEQDYKYNYLWVSHSQIWSILESEYGLNIKEIRSLIHDMVGDTFKIKVSTPRAGNCQE